MKILHQNVLFLHQIFKFFPQTSPPTLQPPYSQFLDPPLSVLMVDHTKLSRKEKYQRHQLQWGNI